jgi:hypothetical protein
MYERRTMVSQPETPIQGMGLKEARRSLLRQIQAERELSLALTAMTVDHLSDDEVSRVVNDFIYKHENILQTVEHIEDLEAKVAGASA